MEFKYKLIAVAILALLSGTAFAAPMLVAPLDVQLYPRVAEGPKAYMNIDVVYANFSVVEGERNLTRTVRQYTGDTGYNSSDPNATRPFTTSEMNYTSGDWSYVNVTETIKDTNVTYTVVANITNLSDNIGYLYEAAFGAARNIELLDSALGGAYFNLGYPNERGPNYGGLVDGIWLDGNWVNTTWIPGTDYPSNLYQAINSNHAALHIIPGLPENASKEGTWIEGVPIAEYYSIDGMTATHIYINGAWVDVTGRVQPHNPQPMVIAKDSLANLVLTPGVPIYSNAGNASVGPVTTPISGWRMGGNQMYRYIGQRGFDRAWLPHQSRLVMFNGTVTYSNNTARLNSPTMLLENGVLDLYGAATSYINNMPINGTFTNTVASATCHKTVTLQKTSTGYLYNDALSVDQIFWLRPDGVELYIKQEGAP